MGNFLFYVFILAGCTIVLFIGFGVIWLGLNSLNAKEVIGPAVLLKKSVDSTSFNLDLQIHSQAVSIAVTKQEYDALEDEDTITAKYYVGQFDKKVYPISLVSCVPLKQRPVVDEINLT